jgi:transcriptional regulator with XRE-family HTH domain
MTNTKNNTFGKIIRKVRRELNWTQDELAQKINVSSPYIGHLEKGKRHPSAKIVERLADTLGLDRRGLFIEANPETQGYLDPPAANPGESAWEQLSKDEDLRRQNNISKEEMEMLSRLQLAGEVKTVRDFIHILNTLRQAIRK